MNSIIKVTAESRTPELDTRKVYQAPTLLELQIGKGTEGNKGQMGPESSASSPS
ncbi:hypothetical protein [Gallionella capsiferriformans]|uniref:hypothetical protein n=1 Tax=Gallionella capsiferriformans TaxID=370405 RepID=UPI0001AB1E79|nr:hypothetical protein [Gallionella capsiferriformans]